MNSEICRKSLVILLTLMFTILGENQPGFTQSVKRKIIKANDSFDSNIFSNSGTRITFQSFPHNFEYNGVRCILKDHKGYMWFGTVDGLIKFDGINTYVYEHNPVDPTSLRHNNINALVEDSIGRLWIGTSKGLNLYNREKDNFISIGNLSENINRLNTNYISALCIDKNSLLWVGTFGDGVNVYHPDKQKVDHYSYDIDDPNSISSNRITCIAADSNNKVWLGTQNGLNLFLKENDGFRHFYVEEGNSTSLSNNNVSALNFDFDGNLWIGTRGGGLNKLLNQDGKFKFKRYVEESQAGSLSNNFVLSLITDIDGSLWIGTENGGLNRLIENKDYFEVYQVEEGNSFSISSNSIWSLYCDTEGRIWIGTSNKGINVIDDEFNKFELYQKNIVYTVSSLTNNDVKGFSEDKEGNVWIAMDGGGICKFNPATKQFSNKIFNSGENKYLANNAIQAILYDSDENLWVGTWAGGLDRLDKNGIWIGNYELESKLGSGNNNVMTLVEDSKKNIWVGTAGSGLFHYNKTKSKFDQILCTNQSSVLKSFSYVTSFLEDSEGLYWIGTLNGLIKAEYDNNGNLYCQEIIAGMEEGSISSNMIDVIFEDSHGRIWLGTADYGLNLYNKLDGSSKVFQRDDGLPSNVIRGILEDDDGFLWITTNKGVSQFNYDSLSFTNFTYEDGLNSNEFYVNSCLATTKGEFYLGGENGFNVFDPKKIKTNGFVPPVAFTNFKINNLPVEIGDDHSPLEKHISVTTEITLSHKQSSFTIEFVALNYTRPKRNQYSYKLEGFDNIWIDAGNNRSANYTNMKPGKYIFLVKGSNNDGIWNTTPNRLYIKIKPPFWKTWWAYCIYVLTVLSVAAITLKFWYERINIKNQLLLEKRAKEKEHELNELNIQFFTNISHEFRTPLSLIIGPLETLINSTQSKVKEQLLIIQRNAGRLLQLTNNLMNLRKLEEGVTELKVQYRDILTSINEITNYFSLRLKRRQINLIIESNKTSIQGWFDSEKLETILLNLLSNAIKYTSDEGTIRMKINSYVPTQAIIRFSKYFENIPSESRFLELKIIDYGKGISPKELPFIFDKFYQAETGGKKNKSGTGIGLTLTKGLVEMHHGRIWAESQPDTETLFTFILPIDCNAYADGEIVNEPTNFVEKEVLLNDFNENRSHDEDFTDTDESEEKPEILIVEDNDELRMFLSKELSKNYKIIAAEDGQIGISLALDKIPDLIVSDILMPNSTGIELCKTVKTDIRTCHVPLILLTAKTTTYDQIEGAEIGADAYITKPFNIKLFLAKINQLIQSRKKLYAQFSQDVYIMPNKLADTELDQVFLQKVIDHIIENIGDNKLNVDELANALNMSHSSLYRKVKSLSGKTLVEFIRIIRLKLAIKLMESKKFTIAEIAYKSGFSSPAYFTKSFKDQYGKPPSEFITE